MCVCKHFLEKNLSHFSQELQSQQSYNLVHTWTMGGCVVYTRIGLFLLFHPFISSFFFLPNFQTLNVFVKLLSMSPTKLKVGTHMHNGLMYHVYWNQTAVAAYSFPYFFLSLQFSDIINIFIALFSGIVRPTKLILGTHMDKGLMNCVYQNHSTAVYSSLYFIFSNFQTLQFLLHFSREL